MNKLFNIKRIAVLLGILVLCGLIINASRLAIADINAAKSYQTLKSWQLAPFEMNDDEWDKIENDLEKAHEYDSDNPELLMALGLAHEGRYANDAVGYSLAIEARQKALGYYRQSVRLRPTWPYGWIDLALVKYRLGEVDQEFYDARNNGVELGPWEPGVQRVIVDIGLHGWDSMDEDAHNLVQDTIKRAIIHSDKTHVNTVIELLKKYQILYYACLSAWDDPYVQKVCSSQS